MNYAKENIIKDDICLWKLSYLQGGTTSESWDKNHKCVKCDGYQKECGSYTKVELNKE